MQQISTKQLRTTFNAPAPRHIRHAQLFASNLIKQDSQPERSPLAILLGCSGEEEKKKLLNLALPTDLFPSWTLLEIFLPPAMEHSIERSGSPLYDAIREVMAGTWPEDEYDVAESPLSYVDYKSQVFFDVDGPVAPVINTGGADGTSDTDFESLESDESGWGRDADDTMATEIGTEILEESNTDSKVVAVIEGEILRELFGEIGEGEEEIKVQPKEGGRNGGTKEVRGERVKINSTAGTESDEILRKEILEGPEEAIGPEIELTIATRAESELQGKIEEIFRTEIAAEINLAFNGTTDDEIKMEGTTAGQAAAEVIGSMPAGLVITPAPSDEITPIVDDLIEPPPIPSRSPSRPGTSIANHKPLNEISAIYAPQHRCDSSLSLPPTRLTASSLSTPRSSRFFEELVDPATTTAASIEAPEKRPLSPPLPSPLPSPPQKEIDNSDVKEPLKKKERKRSKFFRSCRLESLFKRLKFGEPKAQKQSGSKHPRATSISSIIKW